MNVDEMKEKVEDYDALFEHHMRTCHPESRDYDELLEAIQNECGNEVYLPSYWDELKEIFREYNVVFNSKRIKDD